MEVRSLFQEIQSQREQLAAERRALEAERESLRQMFDLAPDAYLFTDLDGAVREANRTASVLLGRPHEKLRGRPLPECVPEAHRSRIVERIAQVARSGQPAQWDMPIELAGGARRTVAATVAATAVGDRVVALRWLLREAAQGEDASAAGRRLLLEQAARAQAEAAQRRDAFLSEASEILAGSLDYEVTLASVARLAVPRIADSCIVYVAEENGSVQRLSAAHADPETEAALRGLLRRRPFDPLSLTRPIARAIRTGEAEIFPHLPPQEVESLAEEIGDAALAARVCPGSLMIVPLKIRDRVLGALSFGWSAPGKYTPDALWLARKLADRAALAIENARLHREARRASEAKSDFVAAMSHEFRTPLTAIVAFADLLIAGIPEPIPGRALRHVEHIVTASRHLAELIDQVLTLSRIEAGRERVHPETVDLGRLVRDTAALVEPLARQKGLPLVLDVPEIGPSIETDPNKVRQVLFNLLGNAVKFTEQGEIRVVLRPEPGRVAIEVHDTGEGIPPELLERIWEPFWRAGPANVGRPPGTGLGLGIVKRLVHMLGGEIRARSEPGRGSVFAVVLNAEWTGS